MGDPVRHGALSFEVEAGTGMLRNVRIGSTQILRAAYVAIRDEHWGTAANHVEGFAQKAGELRWIVRSEGADRTVDWACSVTYGDGFLEFVADGRARNGFLTNRTGLCVLHPTDSMPMCIVESPDGSRVKGEFPFRVSPHQPFRDIQSMDIFLGDRERWRIEFDGEVFETEDQRNWSDDSFKTYCRPADWPKPYAVAAGERIRHSMRLTFPSRRAEEITEPSVSEIEANTLVSPSIGLMLGGPVPLAEWQIERLAALRLGHLGVALDARDWRADLAEAQRIVRLLDMPLQVHLYGEPNQALVDALGATAVRELLVDLWREPTAMLDNFEVYAAAHGEYAELNRMPPRPGVFAGVAFAMNPQVHTFDDRSIVESLGTHAWLVDEAKEIALGGKVAVGPITFEPRNRQKAGPRLQTEFGAAWVLGSLCAVLSANPSSVTYLATHGPGGVLTDDPGVVLPVERVFRFVGAGPPYMPEEWTDGSLGAGIRCRGRTMRVNLTFAPLEVEGAMLEPFEIVEL